MQDHPSFTPKLGKLDDSFNVREQIDKYLTNWKWFVLGILLCLVGAVLYLRYAIPEYKATATILVRDERKGGMATEQTAFADLGLLTGIKNNVDNEIEIIKSRTIVERSAKKLNLHVQYFTEGRVKSLEVYKDKPIEISFFDIKDAFYTDAKSFVVNSMSDNKYEIESVSGKKLGTYSYGNVVDLGYCRIIVTLTPSKVAAKTLDYSIKVRISKLANVVQGYKNRLIVAPLNKNSSVVELTLNDPVGEKAKDLLNTIIDIYNKDAVDDKNFISRNTEKFVASRLEIISRELGDVEKDAEGFKRSNRLTDITSDAGIYLQNSVDFEKALIETETQIRIVGEMMEFMNANNAELVPSNIIPNDLTASALIAEHNQLVLERERVLKGATQKNSVIVNYNNRIADMRANVKESLSRLSASLKIRKSDLEKQVNMVSGKISRIPGQEREFKVLSRQQQIKEALYTYLLQKREEIAISLAVTAPNAKVIDSAMATTAPVSPHRNNIYLAAIVLGLLVPFLILYVADLLDTKVKNRQDVEGRIPAPFLGDVPKSETQDEIINANSRSSSAEAIRIVRTNLEFILTKATRGQAKVVAITSTLPKEGKTFVAVNLASTIALSGKKVLLVGLDIRNPKIDKYVKLPSKGLTNYLARQDDSIGNYVVKLDGYDCFDVLPSGIVPPNPVDLLMNSKIGELFAELRQTYEYIIVDTAPVSLVTDTLLIAKYVDAFIYVMRANYLDKRLLKIPQSLYAENKLPNMSLLLNDTIWGKSYGYYGYGYGYGYEQEESKTTWLKRLFRKS